MDIQCNLILCFLSQVVYSFNIDINTPWEFSQAVQDKTTKFGYTVLLQKDAGLVVGAPHLKKDGFRPGGVFRCALDGTNNCVDNDIETKQYLPKFSLYQRQQQLMGLSSSYDNNGNVLVCAPKWVQNVSSTRMWYRGRCSLVDKNFNKKYTFSPCEDQRSFNLYYGYCLSGFSSIGRQDTGSTTPVFYVGAPGAIQFKGTIIEMVGHGSGSKIRTMFTNQDRLNEFSSYMGYSVSFGKFTSATEVVGGAPRASNLRGKVIIYSIDNAGSSSRFILLSNIENPDEQVGSYFGAAVLAVDLNNDGKDDLLVGAPYHSSIEHNEGIVYVFMNKKGSNYGGLDLQSFRLEGDKKANAKFGLTISKLGDLNNDGYEDVAIGAPYEDGIGAVYIYNGGKDGLIPKYSQVIRPTTAAKGFGLSVSSKVDIDSNDYPDIAVGAADSGKAYIFRSRPIITIADDLIIDTTSIPLKKNCDYKDGNVYHCVNLTTKLSFIAKSVNDPFDIEITYSIDDSKAFFKRAFIKDETDVLRSVYKKNITVNSTNDVATVNSVLYFTVRNDPNFDIIEPMVIKTKYRGVDKVSGCSGGNPCPIVDMYGASGSDLKVTYLRECGADKTCDTDLHVTGKLFLPRSVQQSEVLYGVNDEVHLMINVKNDGEAAYVSNMKVNCSSDLSIIGVDIAGESYPLWTSKSIDASTIEMSFPLANPLAANSNIDVVAKFSVGKLPRPSTKTYTFNAKVFALGKDKDTLDDKISIVIPTMVQTCINVQGNVAPSQVIYKANAKQPSSVNTSVSDLGDLVTYTFVVQSKSRIPVDNLAIDIDVASEKDKTTLIYIVDLTVDGVQCEPQKLNPSNFSLIDVNNVNIQAGSKPDSKPGLKVRKRREAAAQSDVAVINCRTGNCKAFKCSINRIDANYDSLVVITTRIWSANFAKLQLAASDLVAQLKVSFVGPSADQLRQKEGCTMSDKVSVTVQPNESSNRSSIEWWIILLAVLGAILLLAIAVAILYKVGFFKRNRKIKNITGPAQQEQPKSHESFEDDEDE